MKSLLFIGATILCFSVSFVSDAIAGECRQLEYSEIKDMSTHDLISAYCDYGLTAHFAHEKAHLAREYGQSFDEQEKDKEYDACTELQQKIITSLKKRHLKAPKKCLWEKEMEKEKKGKAAQ